MRPQQSSSPETSIITTSTPATTSPNHQPLQVRERAAGQPSRRRRSRGDRRREPPAHSVDVTGERDSS
jgi:hypothetical protein